MCPSYRVTRDEKHSTRGRANALREAIRGNLEGGLSNPELYDKPTNFLEAIIAAQRTEGVEFTDEEIYANVIQLLLAGEDTTANTIARPPIKSAIVTFWVFVMGETKD